MLVTYLLIDGMHAHVLGADDFKRFKNIMRRTLGYIWTAMVGNKSDEEVILPLGAVRNNYEGTLLRKALREDRVFCRMSTNCYWEINSGFVSVVAASGKVMFSV